MSTLTKLATDMRQLIAPTQRGYVHRVLFGGLHVILERREATWRLAIARINKPPSQTEAATVARDFGLPAGTEWTYAQRSVKANVGRGRQPKLTYQVLECTWIERDSPSTEESAPDPSETDKPGRRPMPASRSWSFEQFDAAVRAEMQRLGQNGSLPTGKVWDQERSEDLPTLTGVMRRYDTKNMADLAAKLGLQPAGVRPGPVPKSTPVFNGAAGRHL